MKAWRYESASDLDQQMVERLRRFPREPDMLVYGVRSIVALIIRAWLRTYHRFEIIGSENLPNEESFIVVANHSSHLDALCLLAALPLRRLHRAFPVAADDYFFQTIPRIWFSSVIVNAMPFARRVHIRRSLALCGDLLTGPGNVVIIFPEGTRSTTGVMQEFKPGIGALVAGRNVKVLPCYLDGTFKAWPKGARMPRPGKLRLTIGAPRCYASVRLEQTSAATIAAELQRAVKDLHES